MGRTGGGEQIKRWTRRREVHQGGTPERAGHVAWMPDWDITRKVFFEEIYGKIRKGRPRLRLEDGVASDFRNILGVRNWRAAANNRDNWMITGGHGEAKEVRSK